MNNPLNYFGLCIKKDSSFPYSYNHYDYISMDQEKIKIHREMLKSIESKEESRLASLETKTPQLITYTGIIFSALSLFIPVILDKISEQSLFTRILIISALILAFLFYFLTINNAIRNYNIGKFIYSGSDPNNTIKYQTKSVIEFTVIEVQDLLYSIKQNLKTNNDKANNLIYAYRTFRVANVITAILGSLICISLLFPKKENANCKKQELATCEDKPRTAIKEEKEEKILNQNVIIFEGDQAKLPSTTNCTKPVVKILDETRIKDTCIKIYIKK